MSSPPMSLRISFSRACWLYYKLHKAEEGLKRGDEWYIENLRQDLAQQDRDRKGRRRASPGIAEDITVHLSELRRKNADDVRDLPPQIEKLESELAAAWENIDILDTAWAVLVDASVKEAEVEAISSLEGAAKPETGI